MTIFLLFRRLFSLPRSPTMVAFGLLFWLTLLASTLLTSTPGHGEQALPVDNDFPESVNDRPSHLFPPLAMPALQSLPREGSGKVEGFLRHGVLSFEDRALYQKIFILQRNGNFEDADQLVRQLGNPILMGHVLHQRYMHPTDYRSSYTELKNWLKKYADHPGGRQVYRLAYTRSLRGAKGLRKYVPRAWRELETTPSVFKSSYSKAAAQRVRYYIKKGSPTRALHYINKNQTRRRLTTLQHHHLKRQIATSYFFEGVHDKAIRVIEGMRESYKEKVPLVHWTAGLSFWKKGNYPRALEHFQKLAENTTASPAHRAAASFWAARAFMFLGNPAQSTHFLRLAVSLDRGFYGLLAQQRLLGRLYIEWHDVLSLKTANSPSSSSHRHVLFSKPFMIRALALIEAGNLPKAEEEIIHALGKIDTKYDKQLAVFAQTHGMATVELHLDRYSKKDHANHLVHRVNPMAYPFSSYAPQDGFRVDRALIFALMRQESFFKANAVSRAGARGLMQIMPATAAFIAKDRRLRHKGRYKLSDPAFNMSLGQRYLEYLMSHKVSPQNNLLSTLICYNAGPGNLAKWLARHKNLKDDPLFFIENIPITETRLYVKYVLANLWHYRLRFDQDVPSLRELAAGKWPAYYKLDGAQETQGISFAPSIDAPFKPEDDG